MGLLSPWFLLGGLAVGIPIWLHLIRREQPTRIHFSSLMFFRRMPVKSVSRKRLKYLLLLATRTLIILLIALAFAKPYFPFADQVFSSKPGDKHLVILLDNSLSMQYRDRWQRALAAARDAIAGLGVQDRAQIVTFNSEYEIKNLPSTDKPALRAILDGAVSLSASTTSYPQAFRAVEKIAEDAGRPLSVVLISDMQKSGMGAQLKNFPSAPLAEFQQVDVSAGDSPNWTLGGVRSHRVIYQASYPDRLLAEVRGFNTPEASKEITLSVGNKVVDRKTVHMPASGSATVSFDKFDVPVGSNQAEIRISPPDELTQDDSLHFVLERREPYRLLFFHEPGEGRELYYFKSALAAEADSPFAVDAQTPAEAAGVQLHRYEMVILSNVADLPSSLGSQLKEWIGQGGGLLATMGSRFPAAPIETQWKELWPGKGYEKRMMTSSGDRMVLLGEFDKDHPLFREFRETGAAESLRAAEIFAYVRIQPEGTALLRFSNGDPALIERRFGQGRVLLFASSFDNVWSDFPVHPAFIPLVHQLTRYGAQLSDEPPAYTIPAAVSLNEYKTPGGIQSSSQWDVIAPDGKRGIPLAQELRPDFLVLRQAGFYQLRQRDNSHLIAANSDPRESDLGQLSKEDRALWAGSASAKPEAGGAGGNSALAKRQNIWWNLLVVAFLLALVEAYLANRYLGSRRAVASSETAKESAYAG